MKTGIYLSYIGLGANLLHLSYCHQIAKKYGPVTIITLCKNLKEALADDPLIEDVYYLDKYHKKLLDIFNLSKFLKQFHFQNLSTKCFWMRNTSIPLDIKFIGSNSEIIEKGIPFSEKSICRRAKLVVEANRGELIGSRQYGKRY